MKTRKLILAIALVIMGVCSAQAQCKFKNTAFKSGEFLTYNFHDAFLCNF